MSAARGVGVVRSVGIAGGVEVAGTICVAGGSDVELPEDDDAPRAAALRVLRSSRISFDLPSPAISAAIASAAFFAHFAAPIAARFAARLLLFSGVVPGEFGVCLRLTDYPGSASSLAEKSARDCAGVLGMGLAFGSGPVSGGCVLASGGVGLDLSPGSGELASSGGGAGGGRGGLALGARKVQL
jgi:hypothetical protein